MKRIETGRTLLETLAVLALIGLLSISGMLGYSFLHVYFQKQEFVKEIDKLAISYAATPVKPQNDGRVAIKAIYPSAQRVSPTEMVLPGGGKAEIIVLNETASEFAVVTNGVDPDMCEEYLKNGSYKAVRYPERINGNRNDRNEEPSIVGKDSLKGGIDGISTREFIESICGTRVGPALYYGGCPQRGWSYWHTDGQCHRCSFGTPEDRYGICCSTDEQKRTYAGCGVCDCPNGGVCDSASHQCVECVVDNDCKDPNDPSKLKHEGKPRCDRTNHVCVECLDEGDCNAPGATCRRACDSVTHTCGEGCKVNSWWQRLNGQCVCRNLISMGNECPLDTTCGPGDCCSGNLSCQDIGGTGRCCPTEEKTCPAGSCCESVAVGGCPHARLEYGEFTQEDSQELDTVDCVCRTKRYYHCAKTGEYYLGGTLSADKHIVTGGTLQASAPVVSPSCVVPAAPQACNPATQCCADPVTDVCGRSGYETVTAKSKLTSWILKDNVRCVSTEIEYCPGDGTTANSCTCPSKPKDATCSTATGKTCTSGANTEACDCPCDTGLECVDGKCSESCPSPLPTYDQACTTDCGCLAGVGLTCSTESQKCVCADPKQVWDPTQGKCVNAACSVAEGGICWPNYPDDSAHCCAEPNICIPFADVGHCCPEGQVWDDNTKQCVLTDCEGVTLYEVDKIKQKNRTYINNAAPYIFETGRCCKEDGEVIPDGSLATNGSWYYDNNALFTGYKMSRNDLDYGTKYACCPVDKVVDSGKKKTCCPNNGEVGVECKTVDCCVSGTYCSGLTASPEGTGTLGHCCPEGQVWDDSTKKCTSDSCPDDGDEAAICPSDDCCNSGLHCSNPNKLEMGHCCPTGTEWDPEERICTAPLAEACFTTDYVCKNTNAYVNTLWGGNSEGVLLFSGSTDAIAAIKYAFDDAHSVKVNLPQNATGAKIRAKSRVKSGNSTLTKHKIASSLPGISPFNSGIDKYGSWVERTFRNVPENTGGRSAIISEYVSSLAGDGGGCSGAGDIVVETCVQYKPTGIVTVCPKGKGRGGYKCVHRVTREVGCFPTEQCACGCSSY